MESCPSRFSLSAGLLKIIVAAGIISCGFGFESRRLKSCRASPGLQTAVLQSCKSCRTIWKGCFRAASPFLGRRKSHGNTAIGQEQCADEDYQSIARETLLRRSACIFWIADAEVRCGAVRCSCSLYALRRAAQRCRASEGGRRRQSRMSDQSIFNDPAEWYCCLSAARSPGQFSPNNRAQGQQKTSHHPPSKRILAQGLGLTLAISHLSSVPVPCSCSPRGK